jgi:hypothetical protein
MPRRSAVILAVVGTAVVAGLIYLFASGFIPRQMQLNQLSANSQKWESQAVRHYRMNVSILCFCAFRDRMPLTVEAKDGKLISVVDNKGRAVPADDPLRTMDDSQLLTVEGLFGYTRDAIQRADETRVSYDPQAGYPVSISVDWIKMAMDDELGVQISGFQVLP